MRLLGFTTINSSKTGRFWNFSGSSPSISVRRNICGPRLPRRVSPLVPVQEFAGIRIQRVALVVATPRKWDDCGEPSVPGVFDGRLRTGSAGAHVVNWRGGAVSPSGPIIQATESMMLNMGDSDRIAYRILVEVKECIVQT